MSRPLGPRISSTTQEFASALEADEIDVLHVGIFDLDATFRERRLPRAHVSAYRRMTPGNWAPRTPTWGIGNYTTAVRASACTPESARIEFRVPGADTNPYLAIAVALATGLWGIENGIEPPPPLALVAHASERSGIDPLPGDLSTAVRRLEASETIRELIGHPFLDYFIASRNAEIAAFRRHVSAFERARYIEVM